MIKTRYLEKDIPEIAFKASKMAFVSGPHNVEKQRWLNIYYQKERLAPIIIGMS